MRISKDEYYLNIALTIAQRSTCLRSCYGAVLVKDDRIISTGYNGSARGEQNCTDRGVCFRQNSESRTNYDVCPAVHAEENAIANCLTDTRGAAIYISGMDGRAWHDDRLIKRKFCGDSYPCSRCRSIMINAGIEKAVVKALTGVLYYALK